MQQTSKMSRHTTHTETTLCPRTATTHKPQTTQTKHTHKPNLMFNLTVALHLMFILFKVISWIFESWAQQGSGKHQNFRDYKKMLKD